MVVALGTVQGQTKERLARVLNGSIKPGGAVEEIVVTREEARGSERLGILGRQFIGRNHFLNHPVIALVLVERLHNPIAPMPDVLLAVAQLRTEPVPVRVPPNIHPVPRPTLAVLRVFQKLIDDFIPRPSVRQLRPRRRQPDEVEVQPPNQNRPLRFRLRFQTTCRAEIIQNDIDWILRIARQRHSLRRADARCSLDSDRAGRQAGGQVLEGPGDLIPDLVSDLHREDQVNDRKPEVAEHLPPGEEPDEAEQADDHAVALEHVVLNGIDAARIAEDPQKQQDEAGRSHLAARVNEPFPILKDEVGADEGHDQDVLPVGVLGRQRHPLDEVVVKADRTTLDYDRSEFAYLIRDRATNRVGAEFNYQIAPSTELVFDFTRSFIRYDNNLLENSLESNENRLLVGIAWENTAATSGYAKIGYKEKEFAASNRDNFYGTDWEVAAEMNEHHETSFLDNYESVMWYCYDNYPGINVWKLDDALNNSDFDGIGIDIQNGTYGLLGGTEGYGNNNNSWYTNWAATVSHSDFHDPQWNYGTVWNDAYSNLMDAPNNSLAQLAWYTLMINLHETGWHDEGEVAGWEHHYSSHMKNANVYAEAARWANGDYTETTASFFSDIDHDGGDELIMHNDKIFAVFEGAGGRVSWLFYSDGAGSGYSVVGSDVAYYSETDGDYNEDSNNHVAALSDVSPNQQHELYNIEVITGIGSEVQAVLSLGSVTKTISLTEGNNYLDVQYQFTEGTGYIKSGWTPDLLDIIWSGKSHLQRIFGEYASYSGYRNSSSGATVALALGSGGAGHNFEFEGTLVKGDEIYGAGTFNIYLFAGYTSEPYNDYMNQVVELDDLASGLVDIWGPQLNSAIQPDPNVIHLFFSDNLSHPIICDNEFKSLELLFLLLSGPNPQYLTSGEIVISNMPFV